MLIVVGLSISAFDVLPAATGTLPFNASFTSHGCGTDGLWKNLIPLLLFRPLRICVPSGKMRSARIVLLKITHFPYIGAIWLYEELIAKTDRWQSTSHTQKRINPTRPRPLHLKPKNRGEVSPPKTPLSAGRRRAAHSKAQGLVNKEIEQEASIRRLVEETVQATIKQLSDDGLISSIADRTVRRTSVSGVEEQAGTCP